MTISTPGLVFLPAGEERLRLAVERGHEGDDPDLPLRWVELREGDRTVSVGVGPVAEPAGAEENLWKLQINLGIGGW